MPLGGRGRLRTRGGLRDSPELSRSASTAENRSNNSLSVTEHRDINDTSTSANEDLLVSSGVGDADDSISKPIFLFYNP